jgi:hypothetical protein
MTMNVEPLEFPDNLPACYALLGRYHELQARLQQQVTEKEQQLTAKRRRVRQLRTRLARKRMDARRLQQSSPLRRVQNSSRETRR